MVPDRDGGANRGHACVKGRFAYGYATHEDRITKPMIRAKITDPWREVSWDEAFALRRFRVQAHPGEVRPVLGGRHHLSRCTNEEAFLVQKLVRAALGTNNVDTCARVCHSPTGYGLKQTLGESAGTQNFDSVMKSDVIMVIGANPTDGHPVFGSRMKRRLREGAKLIVADPREIDLVRSPHVAGRLPPAAAARHQRRAVQFASRTWSSPKAWSNEQFVAERCEPVAVPEVAGLRRRSRTNSPEAMEAVTGVPARHVRAGRAPVRHRRQWRHLLRPRRHRAQPGQHHGDGHRQPRHGHRQPRPRRRGRESAARPEQCAGLLRHGFVPARAGGLPPHLRRHHARAVRQASGASRIDSEPGPAHPQHDRGGHRGQLQGACTSRARTRRSPIRTPSMSPPASRPWSA